MEELYNIGISSNDLENITYSYPEIRLISNEDIKSKIDFLKRIGCTDYQVRNIVISNPWYFRRELTELENIINTILSLGISNLSCFINDNPFFLNKDICEIVDYINNALQNGQELKTVVSMLEDNPMLIDK